MSIILQSRIEIRGNVHRTLSTANWNHPSICSLIKSETGDHYFQSGKIRFSLNSQVCDVVPKAFSIIDTRINLEQNVLSLLTMDGKRLDMRTPDSKSFFEWQNKISEVLTFAVCSDALKIDHNGRISCASLQNAISFCSLLIDYSNVWLIRAKKVLLHRQKMTDLIKRMKLCPRLVSQSEIECLLKEMSHDTLVTTDTDYIFLKYVSSTTSLSNENDTAHNIEAICKEIDLTSLEEDMSTYGLIVAEDKCEKDDGFIFSSSSSSSSSSSPSSSSSSSVSFYSNGTDENVIFTATATSLEDEVDEIERVEENDLSTEEQVFKKKTPDANRKTSNSVFTTMIASPILNLSLDPQINKRALKNLNSNAATPTTAVNSDNFSSHDVETQDVENNNVPIVVSSPMPPRRLLENTSIPVTVVATPIKQGVSFSSKTASPIPINSTTIATKTSHHPLSLPTSTTPAQSASKTIVTIKTPITNTKRTALSDVTLSASNIIIVKETEQKKKKGLISQVEKEPINIFSQIHNTVEYQYPLIQNSNDNVCVQENTICQTPAISSNVSVSLLNLNEDISTTKNLKTNEQTSLSSEKARLHPSSSSSSSSSSPSSSSSLLFLTKQQIVMVSIITFVILIVGFSSIWFVQSNLALDSQRISHKERLLLQQLQIALNAEIEETMIKTPLIDLSRVSDDIIHEVAASSPVISSTKNREKKILSNFTTINNYNNNNNNVMLGLENSNSILPHDTPPPPPPPTTTTTTTTSAAIIKEIMISASTSSQYTKPQPTIYHFHSTGILKNVAMKIVKILQMPSTGLIGVIVNTWRNLFRNLFGK